ncbi:MAG: hypothetical protein ACK5MN_06005 [Lachnospiraceae bacterium]
MDQVLNKLSEIESIAQQILDQAEQEKKNLALALDQQCKEFAAKRDEEAKAEVKRMQEQMTASKDTDCTQLKSKTTDIFSALDSYYQQNHERLCDEIYQKIIRP